MERGRYWGVILDGPYAGDVLEHHSSQYMFATAMNPFAATFEPEQAPSLMNVETHVLYHHRMQLGGRFYGVWMDRVMIGPDDMTRTVLALIDMDPAQAKLCEYRPNSL